MPAKKLYTNTRRAELKINKNLVTAIAKLPALAWFPCAHVGPCFVRLWDRCLLYLQMATPLWCGQSPEQVSYQKNLRPRTSHLLLWILLFRWRTECKSLQVNTENRWSKLAIKNCVRGRRVWVFSNKLDRMQYDFQLYQDWYTLIWSFSGAYIITCGDNRNFLLWNYRRRTVVSFALEVILLKKTKLICFFLSSTG